MRALKFRAWDTSRNEMVDGWYEVNQHSDGEYSHMYKDASPHYRIRAVMQYTGLHDKNGTEIYEGDILLFPDGERIQVIWMEYPAAFSPMDLHQASKVIGNIWENKDLLK